MRRIPEFSAVVVLLLCAGCGQGQAGAPSVPIPTASVRASAGPSASTPSVSSSASPSPAGPSVPDTSGALDVSRTVKDAGFASFASPSGKIWCAIYDEDALCHFPYDFTGKIPSWKKVCPDEDLDVTGVEVQAKGADYFCSGDPEADPRLEDSDAVGSTGWWKPTGWPSVKLDDHLLATLPYGKSLVAGDYICASATNGVTCANTATGKGFRMARAGVGFIS